MIYIHKGQIVENNAPIDEIVRSYLIEEMEYAHIIMSQEMLLYWKENPNATVEQIFNLETI